VRHLPSPPYRSLILAPNPEHACGPVLPYSDCMPLCACVATVSESGPDSALVSAPCACAFIWTMQSSKSNLSCTPERSTGQPIANLVHYVRRMQLRTWSCHARRCLSAWTAHAVRCCWGPAARTPCSSWACTRCCSGRACPPRCACMAARAPQAPRIGRRASLCWWVQASGHARAHRVKGRVCSGTCCSRSGHKGVWCRAHSMPSALIIFLFACLCRAHSMPIAPALLIFFHAKRLDHLPLRLPLQSTQHAQRLAHLLLCLPCSSSSMPSALIIFFFACLLSSCHFGPGLVRIWEARPSASAYMCTQTQAYTHIHAHAHTRAHAHEQARTYAHAHARIPDARNALRWVFNGLARERYRFMNWPYPSPARSLSLVVG